MKLKISLKQILYIVSIIAIIFSGVTTFFPNIIPNLSNDINYIEPIPIPPQISRELQDLINKQSGINNIENYSKSGLPVRLKIPKINVSTIVEYVGLTSGGAMDVPKGPDNVAWFNLGARPGDTGSAVIAGHYGWKNNIPAVFDNLYKLKKGDKIYTEDDSGVTSTFIVTEIGVYDQYGDAANVFGSNDGKAHLNLITCQGVWNTISKTRPSRLVIFTDKVL